MLACCCCLRGINQRLLRRGPVEREWSHVSGDEKDAKNLFAFARRALLHGSIQANGEASIKDLNCNMLRDPPPSPC